MGSRLQGRPGVSLRRVALKRLATQFSPPPRQPPSGLPLVRCFKHLAPHSQVAYSFRAQASAPSTGIGRAGFKCVSPFESALPLPLPFFQEPHPWLSAQYSILHPSRGGALPDGLSTINSDVPLYYHWQPLPLPLPGEPHSDAPLQLTRLERQVQTSLQTVDVARYFWHQVDTSYLVPHHLYSLTV